MDAVTRQTITDIAAQTRTTLVVDETMVDLWFDVPPPPPLAAFNPEATVMTLGSAGKSFWGGLRLGWIRASSRTIATLAQTRDTLDLGSPVLEQLATLWLIENSATFLPARRQMLAERRDRCGQMLREHFPNGGFRKRREGFHTGLNYPACWRHSWRHAPKRQASLWAPARVLDYQARLTATCVCPSHSVHQNLKRHYCGSNRCGVH